MCSVNMLTAHMIKKTFSTENWNLLGGCVRGDRRDAHGSIIMYIYYFFLNIYLASKREITVTHSNHMLHRWGFFFLFPLPLNSMIRQHFR